MPLTRSKLDPGSTVREDELLIAQAEIARSPDPLDPGSTVREGEYRTILDLDPKSVVREGEFQQKFNPEGSNYDMKTALEVGMTADENPGENFGHFGSVAPTSSNERKKYNLPEESYLILKGRKHSTFHKAEEAEKRRGFKVIKKGSRYYSVPDPKSVVREGEFGLGKLGTEIVGYMPAGRPIISNPDGSYSTERTTTIKLSNGKWINIPTIFDGKEVSVDQAFDIMRQYGFKDPETGKKAKEFKSEPEASKAAASGSKAKDKVLMEAIKRHKAERRDFPSMFDESGRRI